MEVTGGWGARLAEPQKPAILPIQKVFAAPDQHVKQGKTHIRKRCKSVTFAHSRQ